MTDSIIQCKDLCLGYAGNILTEPLNFSIQTNQWLGIVGENGIGKSTFFKTILGILPQASGNITVMGKNPGKANNNISYIPQERELNLSAKASGITLIQASFKGNRWGLPITNATFKHKLKHLLDIVGAKDYAHLPFHMLSGGQKKRIYLVQALINKPKLLLLDEPLSDLDQQAKHDFIRALKRIHHQENITLLIISHDMHEIADELNTFIHFKARQVHFCRALPCLKEDADVTL